MRGTKKDRRAKARQAAKLAQIRQALITAGCDTTAKQAAVLGLGRSTTWAVLNSDKRAGPSANVIKRILSSSTLPPAARQKIEEYVGEKIRGLYGHSEPRKRAFRDAFRTPNLQRRRLKHLPKPSGARPRTVPSLAIFLSGHAVGQEKIVVASTTSTKNSGLFGYLLPLFKQKTSITVKVLAQGTGRALDTGRRGDADVLFVHAKWAERKFLAEGEGVKRFPVMHNDFVLIGPKNDPASIQGITDVAKALKAIKDKQATFISRGDHSGTHLAELALWKKDVGIDVEGENGAWYKSVERGMMETLYMACVTGGYVLSIAARGFISRTRVILKFWLRATNGYSTSIASFW